MATKLPARSSAFQVEPFRALYGSWSLASAATSTVDVILPMPLTGGRALPLTVALSKPSCSIAWRTGAISCTASISITGVSICTVAQCGGLAPACAAAEVKMMVRPCLSCTAQQMQLLQRNTCSLHGFSFSWGWPPCCLQTYSRRCEPAAQAGAACGGSRPCGTGLAWGSRLCTWWEPTCGTP